MLSDLFFQMNLREQKPNTEERRHMSGVKDSFCLYSYLLLHAFFSIVGCIADRDFIPGNSILDNIIDAIKKSYKVILILTDHFVTSNWCQYEADQAIIKSLNLDSNVTNCVVPIMLEECSIPEKINNLNFIDMTIKRDFVQEMMRLKKVLLPGEN